PIALGEPIHVGKDKKGRDVFKFSAEDQAKIDDVEARSAAMMLQLGAKPGTQNIDRILRLPDTINLPNKKKRDQGRTKCPTKLLWFNDASYPLDAFPSAVNPYKVAEGFEGLDPDEVLGEGISKPRDETPSGYGFRFMRDCHAKGMNYDEARA